jgi:hypothetical protein
VSVGAADGFRVNRGGKLGYLVGSRVGTSVGVWVEGTAVGGTV